MAGPEKRRLGGHLEWIGVLILAPLGLLVIPRHKLLRARDAIQRTPNDRITFGEYRALMGLLEHLRFVARLEADATNTLYRPHGSNGQGQQGPNAVIYPDPTMREKLSMWLHVIPQCEGTLCTLAFTTYTMRAAHHDVLHASVDAAGKGEGTPGLGGYMHGLYWRIPLGQQLLQLLHITAWETIASTINILVANRLAGRTAVLSVRSDAALAPYVLSTQASSSAVIQTIIEALLSHPQYDASVARRLVIQHIGGDGNVFSDLVSRGLWAQLDFLCSSLNIRPIEVCLSREELELVHGIVRTVTKEDWHIPGDGKPPFHVARSLTPSEQGRGKRRRDNSDGDGPPFIPPWKRQCLHTPTQAARATPTAAIAHRRDPQRAPTQRSEANAAHLEHLIHKLAADRTPGRIAAPERELREMAVAVTEARERGVNSRTRGQEDLAWRQFTEFAGMRGFDPYLRTEWTRRFPERESILLTPRGAAHAAT